MGRGAIKAIKALGKAKELIGKIIRRVGDIRTARRAARAGIRSGGGLDRAYSTSKGAVGILADVTVDGRVLKLTEAAIYPLEQKKLRLGPAAVRSIGKQLADEMRGLGFKELQISGLRYSGSKPGQVGELIIDLTK